MKFYRLTADNFLMYAVKNYSNPNASGVKEFNQDMKTFVYIKKLLNKMERSGIEEVNPQLLVNHVITLVNLFTPKPTARMLFSYFEQSHSASVISLMRYLNILPDHIPECPDIGKREENSALTAQLENIE